MVAYPGGIYLSWQFVSWVERGNIMTTYVVYTDDLKPGMVIGSSVLGRGTTPLVNKGVSLTENLIASFKKHGILQVNIMLDNGVSSEAPSLLSSNLAREGKEKVEAVLSSAMGRLSLNDSDVSALAAIMTKVIDELFDGGSLMMEKLKAISDRDSVTYDHCWSVAVLSLALYKEARDSEWLPNGCYQDAVNIGIGALLHDIGKLSIPPSILNKPGPLDEEEWNVMKSHPSIGLEIARKHPNIMPMARGIIIHHHQRLDGKGYGPLEKENILCGDKIPRIVRLVTVADIYDALSTDRPYRPGFIPWSVLKIMKKSVGSAIDPFAFELLERIIVPFPSGAFLITKNGEICVVMSSGVDMGQRENGRPPSIKVLATVGSIKKSVPGDILRLEPSVVLLGAITLRGLAWRITRELSGISEALSKMMTPSRWLMLADWKEQILSAFLTEAGEEVEAS